MTLLSRNSDLRQLADLLDLRRDVEADIKPRVVVGREFDGAEVVQPLDGECTERGEGANAAGQVTLRPSAWSPSRLGRTGASEQLDAGVVHLDSHEPRLLPRGGTYTVALTGRGFRAGMAFRHLLAGEQVHPGVTIDRAAFVDATSYTLTVTVAPDAQLVDDAPLAYQIGTPVADTALQHQKARLYGVTYAAAVGRYQAIWLQGGQLRSGYVQADGTHGRQIGQPLPNEGIDLALTGPIHGVPLVADGSLVGVTANGRALRVFDFVHGQTYSHVPADGYRIAAAALVDGLIYWVAFTPGNQVTCDVEVWRSLPDLSNPARFSSPTALSSHVSSSVSWQAKARGVAFAHSHAFMALVYLGSPFPLDLGAVVIRVNLSSGDIETSLRPASTLGGGLSTLFPLQPIGLPADSAGAIRGRWRWHGGFGGEGEELSWLDFLDQTRWTEGNASANGSIAVVYDPTAGQLSEVDPRDPPTTLTPVQVEEPFPALLWANF